MSLFRKINLALGALAFAILAIAIVQYRGFSTVQNQTHIFLNEDIPEATQTLKMLGEISDIHVNLLRYIQGDDSQGTSFESNAIEFQYFRGSFPEKNNRAMLRDVDVLFKKLTTDSRRFVLKSFDPSDLKRAQFLTKELFSNVGEPLYDLVHTLVDEEVKDAGSSREINEILNDDIPGINSYMALQNSVRIMLSSLDRYVLGDVDVKQSFFEHALNAQKELAILRDLEKLPVEIVRLDELERLTNLLKNDGAEIFSSYSNTSKAQAEIAMNNISNELIDELQVQLDNTSKEAQKKMEVKISTINQLSSKTILIINISSLLAVVAVLLLTLFIRKSVISPMNEIVEIVRKIRLRKEDWTPQKTDRNDEVGEVLNSLVDLHYELEELEKMREDHMKEFEAEHMSKLQTAYDEVKANEENLKKQSEHIKAINKELEQFVHIASHDLREPVKILVGYCEMLKIQAAGTLNDSSNTIVDKIQHSGVRMAQLIDDLRMLTKLNQQNIPKEIRSIKKVVDSIVSDYSEQLDARNATVNITSLPTLNCYPTFVWQLFDNLLRNALVHGPEKLEISVYCEERNGENVIIFSNNCNDSEEMSDELFLPFRRGKETKKQGTGIGLSVCKKIVDLHNGDIWIDNNQSNKFAICMTLKEE